MFNIRSWTGGTVLLVVFAFFTIADIADAQPVKRVYYILPSGRGYSGVGIDTPESKGFYLHFGDEITVTGRSWHREDLWYTCRKGDKVFYLPEAFVNGGSSTISDAGGNIVIGGSPVDRMHPLPLDYRPDDLVPVPLSYKASGYERRELLLREEALAAFMGLVEEARSAGIHIGIISAFRDARYQAMLYERAVKRHGLDQDRVAKPGHSEHQLGTACDLTTDEIASSLSRSFENTSAYRWLIRNAQNHGIALSYPMYKEGATGYMYEPWHFRYWGRRRWDHLSRKWHVFYTP